MKTRTRLGLIALLILLVACAISGQARAVGGLRSLTVMATIDQAQPGEAFTYVVGAIAGDGATTATISDTLPAGVIVEGASATSGSCSQAGQLVSCDISLAPGHAWTLVIQVVIAPDAAGVLCNQASGGGLVSGVSIVRVVAAPPVVRRWLPLIER